MPATQGRAPAIPDALINTVTPAKFRPWMSNKDATKAQLSLLEKKEERLTMMIAEHAQASAHMKNALEFALRMTPPRTNGVSKRDFLLDLSRGRGQMS